MTPEAKVKAKITRLLDGLGVEWETPIGSAYGKSNRLDFTACVPTPSGGRYLGIEAKADAKSKVSERQRKKIRAIQAAKGVALVVHKDNLDELVAVLAQLMEVTVEQIELLVRASHAQKAAAGGRPRRTIQAG